MQIVEGILLLSCLCILFRLWRGPTAWDRLLAYNTASNRVVVLLALVGVATKRPVFADVAIT
ncbi:cation:proton antiporter, partial [Candidatus Bipolaricaulota bacterium]|nr:cation:proton antiporter [Candidatus Bipolaricaulota bacterium]